MEPDEVGRGWYPLGEVELQVREGPMVQPTDEGGTGWEEEQKQGLQLGGGAIASIAGGGVLAIFMAQNRDDVTVSFLGWEFTWPVWLLILVSALFGALLWLGLGVLRRHRRRVERRAARRAERD
jgi:uncharacterized integral membrane protein